MSAIYRYASNSDSIRQWVKVEIYRSIIVCTETFDRKCISSNEDQVILIGVKCRKGALRKYGYPDWTFNKVKYKTEKTVNKKSDDREKSKV